MKKILQSLLIVFITIFITNQLIAYNPKWGSIHPEPFVQGGNPIENPKTSPAVSTGYYWINSSDSRVSEPWKPSAVILDTNVDRENWLRILSGPNQKHSYYWGDHREEGKRYFHNPFHRFDTVDNAIAGPIPIGFIFVFNGIAYDSFYVSTNGFIILSNSRYYYDIYRDRQIRSNNYSSPNCYNYMSGDWFRRPDRFGNGINDTTEDDWGYQTAIYTITHPKLQPDELASDIGAAVISPFKGDLCLSQWNPKKKQVRDRGKVYFHRDSNKLIIYYVEAQLKGSVWCPFNNVEINNPDALEPEDNNYLSSNVQVVLNKQDSSVTFVYEKFKGKIELGSKTYRADDIFRYNTVCGLAGYSRHLNYDSKKAAADSSYKGTLPWAGEYTQYTYAWQNNRTENIAIPRASQSIKFKQWKNTLKVCDISFRVRELEDDNPYFTREILTSQVNDFEILAGHEQIGQLQPVAIVENLTNDIQGPNGVNFQKQDLNFRVKCTIINQTTKRLLYNKFVKVDSLAIARKKGEGVYEKIILSKVSFDGKDYIGDTLNSEYYNVYKNTLKSGFNGIPPYGFAEIFFPPFEPNELFITHLGPMKMFVTVEPNDPKTHIGFNDMWSYDDTMSVRFWIMRQIHNDEEFVDYGHEFHIVENENHDTIAIPSVFKWVSLGAEVVSGEDVSLHPLSPRYKYLSYNKKFYPSLEISSPCIRMHRPKSVAIGKWGGDELRSFPIDMRGKEGAILSLAVQRNRKRDDWERGWSDNKLVGVEHRVVTSNWYSVIQAPDELRIEFARPSPNWRTGEGIANIPEENWRYLPRRGGAKPETNMSVFSLFGGGGYMRGFLENDKDSVLSPPKYTNPPVANGLRYDFYDDGIDLEFNRIYIPIPDTFIRAENEGARYFRFRIKEYAKNNQISPTSIPDDEDEFFIDNIELLSPKSEDKDISVDGVYCDLKYSIVPASQAVSIPIKVAVTNHTNNIVPVFLININVFPKQYFDKLYFLNNTWKWEGDPKDTNMIKIFALYNQQARDSARKKLICDKSVYCRIKQIPMLRPGYHGYITMPNWNARSSPPGEYVVLSYVFIDKLGDLNPFNDTAFTTVNIRFGPSFAYDPVPNEEDLNQANNDVATLSGEAGLGLSLYARAMGGTDNYPLSWEVGDPVGGASGQISMKFNLVQEDSIFGYQAFFGSKNSSADLITYQMYDGVELPNHLIPNSQIKTRRGVDMLDNKTEVWNKMVTVLLPKPIVLPKGTYWIGISQLSGSGGLQLGASKSKSAMRCTNVNTGYPQTPSENGSRSIYLNIDKSFRKLNQDGYLVNDNMFAYENVNGSNDWKPFTPNTGNPPYGHLDYLGIPDGKTKTYSRGSWIPLIRPYLKNRKYTNAYNFWWCCLPVELINFNGIVKDNSNDLMWETASETKNYGFKVERRIVRENSNWEILPKFIKGHGTTNIQQEYHFIDDDIDINSTYQYRLIQIDLDGTRTDDDFSNIVTLARFNSDKINLEQTKPNPFSEKTAIDFYLPQTENIRLDIIDIYGNNIITLIDKTMNAGQHQIFWDGRNQYSKRLAAGTYIYRLTTNKEVFTGKMILIR